MRLFLLACCLLVCAAASGVYAEAVSEDDFWRLLEETDLLIRQPSVTDETLADLRERWLLVETVQLDDAEIQVDVSWIVAALDSDDDDDLAELQRHTRALLNEHASRGRVPLEQVLAQDTLARILEDPRFTYVEMTPTPLPTLQPEEGEAVTSNGDASALSQLILIVIGVVLLSTIILYFVRAIDVQSIQPSAKGEDEDPTTSAEAHQRAEGLVAERDYRSAIRYLYLGTLLHLDECGFIHYDRSLTNREHLRQVSGHPQIADVLRSIINVFEDVWYGFEPVDEAIYRSYSQSIERLTKLVER